ncbi:hypothetical protein MKW92_048576 [Papaver armeniacum]|nr:hypothetical protein MKW92_048576 [Papaver armeniacum]
MLSKLISESLEVILGKLIESQAHNHQQLMESQERRQQQLIELHERNQQQMLETLTANFNRSLAEVISHLNKADTEEKHSDENEVVSEMEETTTSLEKDHGNVVDEYELLYNAAFDDDWGKASQFLKNCPEAVEKTITYDNETALHVGIVLERWSFVQELVKRMTPEALEIKDKEGSTALHAAAAYGNKEVAKAIVRKNPKLTQMRNRFERIPLETALVHFSDGQKETVEYLYSVTRHEEPSPFSGAYGALLLCNAIESGYYDLALSLVKRFPKLVTERTTEEPRGYCAFEKLIDLSPFESGTNLSWWERFIYSLIYVDLSSPFDNYDAEEVCKNSSEKSESTIKDKQDLSGSSGALEGDEENPADISKGTKADQEETAPMVSDSLSTKDKGVTGMVKYFISSYIMPYYARVPPIRSLYIQKVMHQQASRLVNYMLEQLDETTTTMQEVTDFLDDTGVMCTAIEFGMNEFLCKCLEIFPSLIWEKFNDETMIQMVIRERNEKILNLILKTSGNDKDQLVSEEDENGNSILHYAAKLAPPGKLNLVSGAALQMQREVQWFKGVATIVHRHYKYLRNYEDESTAEFIFTKEHKGLVQSGEKWMKETSGSCMLVATLIATVAFAAAFTVPGGNISDTSSSRNGVPIFIKEKTFAVFAIADATALFSSITSVLMFLAIMTSRYAEEDFLKSLPQKLIIGLATLFISMASIFVSFGAAFTIVLRDRYKWAPFPVALFGLIAILLFAFLEFPLFLEVVGSTYFPISFGNKSKPVIRRKTTKAKENETKKEL